MNLSPEVDLEDYVARPDKLSGADIASICQEAGMHAVRKNRHGFGLDLDCFRFPVCMIPLHLAACTE